MNEKTIFYIGILVFVIVFAGGGTLLYFQNSSKTNEETSVNENNKSNEEDDNSPTSEFNNNVTPNPARRDPIGRSLDTNNNSENGEQKPQEIEEGEEGYKDGTYTAYGTYSSPGGNEEIEVEITLENGQIKSSNVVGLATNSTSKKWQGYFIDGYKDEVDGKNIDEVELDEVSGSSLTSNGFNDALDQIKDQARGG